MCIILLTEMRTYYLRTKYQRNLNTINEETTATSNNEINRTTTINNRHKNNSIKDNSKYHLVSILPILSYIFYLSNGINTILDIHNFYSCKFGGIITLGCYSLGKLFMYLLFVYRLHTVYSSSTFEYNETILLIITILIIIYGIGMVIVFIFVVEPVISFVNNIRFCNIKIPFYILLIGAAFDMGITGICCILFVRPLCILFRKTNHQLTDTRMKNVISKYIILTFVATLSTTIIFGAIGITDFEALGTIDIVINSTCMMLFNKQYHRLYQTLCCIPIKCAQRCTCCKQKTSDPPVFQQTSISSPSSFEIES